MLGLNLRGEEKLYCLIIFFNAKTQEGEIGGVTIPPVIKITR